MPGVLRFFLTLLVGFVLAGPALAREEISSFTADVVMDANGGVTVTETLDVVAEGLDIRRGIYRDIPTVTLTPDGGKIRADLEVSTVTRDGAPEPFRIERMGNFQRIWIGDANRTVTPGRHSYTIAYTMDRVARSFEDHDELYWNATGNFWIFPIVSATANVTLPSGAVIADLVGYTGEPGSMEQAVAISRTSGTTATFRSQRELGPGEGMSFAVAFQKGVLVVPTGLTALGQNISDLRDVLLPIGGVLLALFYNLLAWLRVGRDPEKGVIIPLFYPPRGFSPALTHYVHYWGFKSWTAFTAAIFDLGVKGLVTIDNAGENLRVSATGKQPDPPLPPGEEALFEFFRERGTVTVDKSSGPELMKRRRLFTTAITSENRSVWFNHNAGYSVFGFVLALLILAGMVFLDLLEPVWLGISVTAGVAVAIIGTALERFWSNTVLARFVILAWVCILAANLSGVALESLSHLSINTASIAAVSIVAITIGFAILMRAPTVQGRKVMDEIDGFKLYLETAEKDRLNIIGEPPLTVERFESILPYAIALGVEKPWSQHFDAELARNAVSGVTADSYRPHWYSGSPTASFSSAGISNAVSAAAAGMTAAMVAAQPAQSSSSGFSSSGGGGGGGGSGGGGGGGGGGGW